MINFALPSRSCGMLLTPATQLHVLSGAEIVLCSSNIINRAPFCSTNASTLRTPCGLRTWKVIGVACPKDVICTGRSTTGAADRANTMATGTSTRIRIMTTKALRTTHCSVGTRFPAHLFLSRRARPLPILCSGATCNTPWRLQVALFMYPVNESNHHQRPSRPYLFTATLG